MISRGKISLFGYRLIILCFTQIILITFSIGIGFHSTRHGERAEADQEDITSRSLHIAYIHVDSWQSKTICPVPLGEECEQGLLLLVYVYVKEVHGKLCR